MLTSVEFNVIFDFVTEVSPVILNTELEWLLFAKGSIEIET